MPHEEVGYLLEQRGVAVVQVRARGDGQHRERELGAVWERYGGDVQGERDVGGWVGGQVSGGSGSGGGGQLGYWLGGRWHAR